MENNILHRINIMVAVESSLFVWGNGIFYNIQINYINKTISLLLLGFNVLKFEFFFSEIFVV
uniref:Uncharacterized protein n=1 Tax=Heterorhabditis bacteriophora TaxID=37862 RepID=A0A1I7WA35_HETBA